MTQPQTYEQFRIGNDFIADDLIAVMFAAGVFDAVFKYEGKRIRNNITDIQE